MVSKKATIMQQKAEIKPPQRKRIIKRKRGDGPSKLYFNSDTQDAIVKYQQSDSLSERELIYIHSIRPAFEKLVENLINIHKFAGLHDSFDDLKSDCMNFLFETIRKFDPNRGTNAFSYFNVVAKNWLVIKTKQKNNMTKKCVSISDTASVSKTEYQMIEEYAMVPSQDVIAERTTSMSRIKTLLDGMLDSAKSDNEKIVLNSIIEIIENTSMLDIMSRGAAYVYIKEVTGMNHKQLSSVMHTLKKRYKSLKNSSAFPL